MAIRGRSKSRTSPIRRHNEQTPPLVPSLVAPADASTIYGNVGNAFEFTTDDVDFNHGPHEWALKVNVDGVDRWWRKSDQSWQTVETFNIFDLTDLSGLAAWWDANTGITLSGAEVTDWQDRTSSAFVLSQPTSANRPIRVSDANFGHVGVRFDGTNDYLSRASTLLSSLVPVNASTIFVVQKQVGSKAQNTTFMLDAPNATNRLGTHLSYSDGLYFDHGNTSAGGRINGSQPANWDDNFKIIGMRRDGSSGKIFVEGGAAVVSGTFTDDLDNTQSGTLYMGATGGSSLFFQGDLLHLVIFNRALPDAEMDEVGRYLAQRTGLTWADVA